MATAEDAVPPLLPLSAAVPAEAGRPAPEEGPLFDHPPGRNYPLPSLSLGLGWKRY